MYRPLFLRVLLAMNSTQRVADLKDYRVPGKLNKLLRDFARDLVNYNGGYYIELKDDPGVYCYRYDHLSRKIRFIKI